MSEFKSVDAWAVVDGGTLEEVHLLEFLATQRAKEDYGYRAKREVFPVTVSPRAEWVKVTPETNFAGLVDEQLWLVLDGSEVVLGTVDAEYDEFHGFTRYSFYSPEKWGEASITVTHYMPAHVPQAPEGDANLTSPPNSISEER